jgi:hypothetical protein
MNGSKQLSKVVTATLSAELKGSVPADLVADIVRAVLDENRASDRHLGVDARGSASSGALRPRPLVCVARTTMYENNEPEVWAPATAAIRFHHHGRNRS